MLTTTDNELAALAAKQWGVLSYEQATERGLSRTAIERRLHTGEFVSVHRGVYRYRATPECWEQRAVAAVLFHGEGAALSGRAAARHWRLPGFRSEAVEVSKPRGRSQRKPYGWVHGSNRLPHDHVVVLRSVPITTAARTAFDLCRLVHPLRAERALDNALAAGLCTITQVDAVFGALARRGRSGTVLMRALLETRSGTWVPATSELEALGRRVLADAGLAASEAEVNLGSDEWIGRVDLLHREQRVVIELDSRRHHAAFLDQQADRERENKLVAAGWRVLRYTWWDLRERPAAVVAEVRRSLA